MRIDLYTLCWNDADMLGFMFRHYDRFVQRYVVYDDGSTDRSLEILRANPKVDFRPIELNSNPDSRTLSAMALTEWMWKESRGLADWVILTEIDEHLHHPHLMAYLNSCKNAGITIIPALGYQMVSRTFPQPGQLLCQTLTMGAPWANMSKLNIFSPDAIETINYAPGRHTARPTGDVRAPDQDELLLLHYKYLDIDRTQKRHEECAPRLRKLELANGWGHKWLWSREQLEDDWKTFEQNLVDVSRPDLMAGQSHPAPRWWENYRMSALSARRMGHDRLDSMDFTKQRKLVQRLVDLTRVGHIDWKASSHAGVFEASFRENSVRIGLEEGRREQERGIMIQLVNGDGVVVGSFTDGDIRAQHTSINTQLWSPIMMKLFEEARRKALGADKEIDERVIDEILFDLDLLTLAAPPPAGEKRLPPPTQGPPLKYRPRQDR